MQCMYCRKTFATAHHKSMRHYVLQVPNALAQYKGKGIIPPAYHQWYLKLYNNLRRNFGYRKRAPDNNVICISELQSMTASLLQSLKKSSHQMTIKKGMEQIVL